ncbi:MAG TPA: hypothetical protein VJO32_04625 [Ktedonobacteraceae bacterium]|nr:hypothetical protein [Ktedonobacteraceae bacterium]
MVRLDAHRLGWQALLADLAVDALHHDRSPWRIDQTQRDQRFIQDADG